MSRALQAVSAEPARAPIGTGRGGAGRPRASREDVLARNHVTVHGEGDRTLVLAHGFGCDQRMWRFVLPALSARYRVVLFDYVGSGNSELAAFCPERYATLDGYARDVVDVIDALSLEDVVLVGHSVSAMIGLIASLEASAGISELVMVCPSPCFLNDPPGYEGGFEREDLEELIGLMDRNYIGWANHLAPLVMGTGAPEALVGELSGSFCSTDPVVAKAFAKATFFSDHRELLPRCAARTLVLQSGSDNLASVRVGEFIHRRLPDGELRVIPAEGHCLHMTDPRVVAESIADFVG